MNIPAVLILVVILLLLCMYGDEIMYRIEQWRKDEE